jgi:nitrite reductase/ring-hydroxylating ferredoxin subunit
MANWTDLLPESDFPQGSEKLCLTVAGRPIVLMCIDGQYHAIRDECPHAGLPLGEGELRGKVITCPYHGYAYNVTNGRNIDFPHDEPPCRTYPTRVEAGIIQADLPA